MHGGKSTGAPKGNRNSITHGIYSKFLTETEVVEHDAIELGTVDLELRTMRIRLSRALAAEALAAGEPEIDEVTLNIGGKMMAVPERTERLRVRDYGSIIDRLASRIESLEKTRLVLKSSSSDEALDDISRQDVFLTADEPGPSHPIL